MRRRDMLKGALIIAAIPVAAHMVWKSDFVSLRPRIVTYVHDVMSRHMDRPGIQEARAYVDDALDLTFSIVAEGVGELAEGPALDRVRDLNAYLIMFDHPALGGREKVAIGGVYSLIQVNYSHQVSEEALDILLRVCTAAKMYQMRPTLLPGG